MKLLLLWLLPLLSYFPAAGPPAVRVTFSPLTKAAYLAAKKMAVLTKPVMTFPVKKARGRIVIPTAKGAKVFKDVTEDMSFDNQEWFYYLGYDSQSRYHMIGYVYDGGYRGQHLVHLVGENGQHVVLPPILEYSPDMRQFVAATDGKDVGHYSQSIQLYRLENNQWQQAWKIEFAEEVATWSTREIQWLSNSTLLLKKCVWNAEGPSTFTYAKLEIH